LLAVIRGRIFEKVRDFLRLFANAETQLNCALGLQILAVQ